MFMHIFGCTICAGVVIIVTILASAVEVDSDAMFIASTFLVIAFEIVVMEPFRTLLKSIGFLAAKDMGSLNTYCENL